MMLLKIENLTKYYGNTLALKQISFSLYKNEIIGLLGVNGAGKSTLMNILSGYLAPSSGNISFEGKEFLNNPIERKKLIGYLPEHPPLYNEMTVYEYLLFIAEIRMKDAKHSIQIEAVQTVMAQLSLVEMQNRLISHLSKGFKQRLGIASSLLGEPPLLIWDEPTAGLDPHQLHEIQQLLRQLKTSHTILISSHMLYEIESICDRIIVIDQGQLISIGTPQQLKEQFQHYRIIRLEVDAVVPESVLNEFHSDLPLGTTIDSIYHANSLHLTITLPQECKEDGRRLIWSLIQKYQWQLLHFSAHTTNLEESFLHLTQPKEH